jgi:S-adenosylmethionine hydrolase
MRTRPILTLLTDFGTQDPFVGIMKGVLLGICPEAALVDLCHEVRPFDIPGGSFLLQSATGYFPSGTIHLAVVDPGVGGVRRPILAEIDGQFFVAPDNGLLSYPMASGRRWVVRHLTAKEFWRHPVSASFHGRDMFAPVAGHLAAGIPPDRFGPIIQDPVRLEIRDPVKDSMGVILGRVVWIDHFGNCITNISRTDVEALGSRAAGPIRIRLGEGQPGVLVTCFAEAGPGGCGAIVGSTGYVEFFSNQGDFAREWRVKSGDSVALAADA